MKRAHVFISGHVQGVTFRATTRKQAEQHGVDGWVKNLDDGRVEAVFEAEEGDTIEAMIQFCHSGPSAARVEDVEVRYEEPEGIDGFRIVR
jgi:acylphosphatase